jgi:hypothetical protein
VDRQAYPLSTIGYQRIQPQPKVIKNYTSAWKIKSYRIKLIAGIILLIAILAYFPFFFQVIENRNGRVIPDRLLDWLTPRDMSVPVFLLIWAAFLLLIIRLFKDADLLLLTIWAYDLLTILRMSFIGLISLDPPAGLIPLKDPLTNLFYGSRYITHDLFFSGHTATVCLICFCLKGRTDKYLTGFATLTLGFLLLIQHVHYTIDVLAAPVLTYFVYRIARRFTVIQPGPLTND